MGRTILIVDDNPHERGIFSTYLQFVGGAVHLAGNGREAVRAAAADRPDLILLDLSMPVMDGWETIRRLKDDPSTARIPVIALTCQRVEWRRLREAGFCGYLEKPLAPFCVLEEVERCIGRVCWKHGATAGRPADEPHACMPGALQAEPAPA